MAHLHAVRIRLLVASAVALVLLIALFSQSSGRADSGVPAQSTNAVRRDILRRARVWQPPRIEIERATLRTDDATSGDVDCRFLPSHLSGTSAKYDCALPTGEEIRVKYRGPERVGEAVATTVLRTLGFGADDVRLVRRVRCRGCPLEPFYTGRIVSALGALSPYSRSIDYDHERTFE